MIFLKNICFLLLFLYGNNCFSAVLTTVDIPALEEVTEGAPTFTETSVSVYEGLLSIQSGTPKDSLCSSGLNFSFQFSSSFEEQMVINYLPYSRNVSPSLDVSAIIFPFHIFL